MIQVQNLVKKFGDFTAVKDISFNVDAVKSSPSSARMAPARPPPSRCSPLS
jgi:hypothetical protein